MEESLMIKGLAGQEIWEKIYGKELNTKKNILEYIDPIFVANLVLSYIKSVNAEHIQPVKNAKELYDKINYMKGVESCGFDDIGIV